MQTYLVVMTLLVLAISCMAETAENTTCAEASRNANNCTGEKDDKCKNLYRKFLGACFSKAEQECEETKHDYSDQGCDRVGEEKDESCDKLKEKIGRICTNELYARLNQIKVMPRNETLKLLQFNKQSEIPSSV